MTGGIEEQPSLKAAEWPGHSQEGGKKQDGTSAKQCPGAHAITWAPNRWEPDWSYGSGNRNFKREGHLTNTENKLCRYSFRC